VELEKEKAKIQEQLDEIKEVMEMIGECVSCGKEA
jgi:hypothetical protein